MTRRVINLYVILKFHWAFYAPAYPLPLVCCHSYCRFIVATLSIHECIQNAPEIQRWYIPQIAMLFQETYLILSIYGPFSDPGCNSISKHTKLSHSLLSSSFISISFWQHIARNLRNPKNFIQAPFKTLMTFHSADWFITGSLIMAHKNPSFTGENMIPWSLKKRLNNQGLIGTHCSFHWKKMPFLRSKTNPRRPRKALIWLKISTWPPKPKSGTGIEFA